MVSQTKTAVAIDSSMISDEDDQVSTDEEHPHFGMTNEKL